MTTHNRSLHSALLAFASVGSFLVTTSCEKRDVSPPGPAIQEPTPPPPAAESASPVPTPTPEAVVPARLGVAKAVPMGLIEGGWEAGGKCNIEAVDGTEIKGQPVTLKGSAHVKLNGWALDPKGTAAADAVHLRFSSPKTGEFYGTASARIVRDDVNKVYPNLPKTAESGYEVEFDTDQLPEGTYAVTTVMQVGDKAYICDNGRKVIRVP